MSGINRFGFGGVYVLHSDHEAEVARLRTELADAHAAIQSKAGWEWKKEADRLRAELQNSAKAALDAVALSCEKEREADALRAEVEGLREVLKKAWEDVNWMTNEGALLSRECFGYLDAAMGASA